MLDAPRALASSQTFWTNNLPVLSRYIEFKALSPDFDTDESGKEKWTSRRSLERTANFLAQWARTQIPHIPGLTVQVHRLRGKTPLIFMEIPGFGVPEDAPGVLHYGHYDKQPADEPWREGLSPWKAVREGDKIYGRGGADDGYSIFASLGSIRLAVEQGAPRPRTVVLIEGSEESGSPHLAAHVKALRHRIGKIELVVCLDSGCGDFERLWLTTSLRGMVKGDLTAAVLEESIHSGSATPVAIDSGFVAMKHYLRLLDDQGNIKQTLGLHQPVLEEHQRTIAESADIIGRALEYEFKWVPGAGPNPMLSVTELLTRRNWWPTATWIGVGGVPESGKAGSKVRTHTTLTISLRVPPSGSAAALAGKVQQVLEANPIGRARVTFEVKQAADGWVAPPLEPWLERELHCASKAFYGNPMMRMGEGGTIPFMGMLEKELGGKLQFVIVGLLSPDAGAHAPNEYLHVPMVERLTASVAWITAAYGQQLLG